MEYTQQEGNQKEGNKSHPSKEGKIMRTPLDETKNSPRGKQKVEEIQGRKVKEKFN